MSNKKLGFIIGRFQPIHFGHIELIDNMIQKTDHHIIFIGSSNVKDNRNPLSFKIRQEIISELYPTTSVIGIPDFNDTSVWSNHLKQEIEHYKNIHNLCQHENTLYTGDKGTDLKEREFWTKHLNTQVNGVDLHHNISATDIRCLIANNQDISNHTPIKKKLLDYF